MSKKKLYTLIGLIPALGLMGRSIYKIQQREAKEAEYAQVVAVQTYESSSKAAAETSSPQSNLGATFKKLGEEAAKDKYETYTPVNDSYGLGFREGAYYIYTTVDSQETLLDGVDLAYVLPVDNQDKQEQFMALFARKSGGWLALNGKGETDLELGAVELTEQTRFIIKDNTLNIAP